jgi:hypothetical protein
LVIHVNKLAYVLVLLVCLSVVMYPFLAQNQTASESVERAHQLVFTLNQTIYVEGDCDNDPFAYIASADEMYGVWILLSRRTSKTNELISALEPTPAWWTYTINRYSVTNNSITNYINEYVVTFYYLSTTTTQVNMRTITTGMNVFYIPSRTYNAYNVYRWILRIPPVVYNNPSTGVMINAQPWSPVKTPWASGQYSLTDLFAYGETQISVSPTYTFSITKINDYQIQFSYSIIFQNSADVGKTIDTYWLTYSYGGSVSQTLLYAHILPFTIQQVGDALVFVFNVYLVTS